MHSKVPLTPWMGHDPGDISGCHRIRLGTRPISGRVAVPDMDRTRVPILATGHRSDVSSDVAERYAAPTAIRRVGTRTVEEVGVQRDLSGTQPIDEGVLESISTRDAAPPHHAPVERDLVVGHGALEMAAGHDSHGRVDIDKGRGRDQVVDASTESVVHVDRLPVATIVG